MESRVRAVAPASTAFYGRLIPQTSDEEEVAAALAALEAPSAGIPPPVTRNRAVSAARTLRNAVLQESRFYRVLHESKLYSIDFGGLNASSTSESAAENGEKTLELDDMRRRAPSLAESDYKVVRIQELTKLGSGRTSSARNRQQMMQQDRNAYSVMKMPEEVVASSGRLQCLVGASNAPTWFIRLAHVENAFMMLSTKETSKTVETGVATETHFLEPLPESEKAIVSKGRFYYRVMVPIELRKGPDLLAPVISRHVFKNAEEIIECHETYRCPQSGVTFVKLAYEDGWLFETLNSGIKVLERLATEPDIQYGHFFFVVKIPVGIRVAPHIMAQRSGKGFKLHSIVEASQRFTPPGSKITYVRVCKDKNSRCGCSRSHAGSAASPKSMEREIGSESPTKDKPFATLAAPSSCHGGWIFETTMDGQVVLEPMAEPKVRQVERLFYRVLDDVEVLPTPGGKRIPVSSASTPSSPPGRRKRLKGTLIECSERLVPAVPPALADAGEPDLPDIGFVKLRHDVGWICERQLQSPYKLLLEQVQGYAVTRDLPKFYRVLVPVYLRSAPDFECPRLPGVAPMTAGTVFESSLQYTPPGSRITYIKVASTSHLTANSACNGWLFDQTPSGDQVLEAVDEDPEKKNGKFFFRVISEKKEVLLSPERTSEVVRYLFANTIFSAEMEYTLPRTQETYVRLTKEKGWVALDPPRARTGSFSSRSSSRNMFGMNLSETEEGPPRTLVRISEELYNLYAMPPSWVSIGHPNRTWFKVPDENCRSILAEETILQMSVFESRNILASSSQGREGVPLSRKGTLSLDDGNTVWNCTLEEIKHPASALLFTFPWKQVWWIFELEGSDERHSVELQHGLRGGFRSILLDGEPLLQNRSVSDMLWDSGSEFTFMWNDHTFKVLITLEGAFFSQYLQFYSYTLVVDEENVVPLDQ
ncbi:hypothetical protein F441_16662 [Phytophthora nicotianae CJ01A1]|uniref:Uncharacterized protein n=5 Tax=Phytophthora nicotianae TaxID=4792 RepID=V9EGH6_PHYNI|nr:hypothetical protein F443_16824 [Phytophthora nicotianae P1569]ETK77372.1 hypothetical protein L915_16361 [Phytophthora nicotianae]ETO65903.1 hypothetical protein F444_16837 [Phytophthora nicotianae P1976]ETP07008.1 hypothetical protein F441_16662 [Phytophthora nicotianae CJ01A1]ETP35101.1 hypothetical protein F442_16655 [Phytophthora nicotianae P10297]